MKNVPVQITFYQTITNYTKNYIIIEQQYKISHMPYIFKLF